MRRKTFDALMATGGLVLAAVLLIAGIMLTWANTFVEDQVTSQLTAQKIFFPPVGEAIEDPRIKPYLEKYAGQQLTDGDQAEAYANHFIRVHLDDATGGRTYAELSTASRANPEDTELAGLVQTAFRGETLRGLLLNAYAFWTMGKIALYASIAAYIGAALMLFLALGGVWHAKRTSPEAEIGVPRSRREPAVTV